MKDYIFSLLEMANEEKCQKCIRIQQELRRLMRAVEDNQLKSKIHSCLVDHDLHYSLGCKPCDPNIRMKEFSRPKV